MENQNYNNEITQFNDAAKDDVSLVLHNDAYGHYDKPSQREQVKTKDRSVSHNDLENARMIMGNDTSADALDRLHGRTKPGASPLPQIEITGLPKKTDSKK